jgi:hypothetical protein
MRRFTNYIAAALLALGVFTLQFEKSAHAQQKTKQRAFYIETQPDAPVLIRDLSATVEQKSPIRDAAEIEVSVYFENRSKKKIALINYGDRAADGSDDGETEERGIDGEGLLPGQSRLVRFYYPLGGEDLIYRIGEVVFEDETRWKSTPFKAAKVKKSKPVFAVGEDLSIVNAPRRTLASEWTTLLFADRVSTVYKPQEIVIEGVKIQTKLHLIKPERLAEVEDCPLTPEQWAKAVKAMEEERKRMEESNVAPIYTEFNYDVRDFESYSFEGRIFAYAVPYYLIEAENQSEIGVGMKNFYIDETGSGAFKLLCDEDVRELKTLPQWIRDLAEK